MFNISFFSCQFFVILATTAAFAEDSVRIFDQEYRVPIYPYAKALSTQNSSNCINKNGIHGYNSKGISTRLDCKFPTVDDKEASSGKTFFSQCRERQETEPPENWYKVYAFYETFHLDENFECVTFQKQNLRDKKFSDALMNGVNFEEADLTNVKIIGSQLRFIQMYKTNFTKGQITGHDLGTVFKYYTHYLDHVDATRANFTDTVIKNIWITQSDFSCANFSGTRIGDSSVDVESKDLILIFHTKFKGTYFKNANLNGVSLQIGNDFSGANFSGADLSGLKMNEGDKKDYWSFELKGAIYDDQTKLPFSIAKAKEIGMIYSKDVKPVTSPRSPGLNVPTYENCAVDE